MKVLNIVLVVLLIFAGLLVWRGASNLIKINHLNVQLNSKIMEQKLEIGKAKTEFGNAQKKIKNLKTELQSELKKNQESATMYAELEAQYEAEKKNIKVETKIVYQDKPIPIPENLKINDGFYQVTENKLSLLSSNSWSYEDFRLKVWGQTEFSRKKIKNTFNYKLNLKWRIKMVQTITPSGAINHYVELYELNNEGKEVGRGVVTKFDVVVEDTRSPNFKWWAPHLDIAAHGGIRKNLQLNLAASIGISLSGYGLTKDDLSWKFARFGVDLNDDIGLSFSPAQYNLGDLIPLFSNLWIGPHVGMRLGDKNWVVGLSLGANL